MFTVSTPCFLSFWDFRTSFFIEEAWVWGVRVGFGGREGALASALISIYITAIYLKTGVPENPLPDSP